MCVVKRLGGWWMQPGHLHKKLYLQRPDHNRGEGEGQRVWVGLALWLIAEIISNVVEKGLKKKFNLDIKNII